MAQIKKLYDKLKRRPTPSDVRYDEVDKLLRYFGFECRQPSGGSSHYIYTHPDLKDFQASIKKSNPMKAVYVRNAVKAVDLLAALKGEGDFSER